MKINELIKCCPMLENYNLWQDEATEVWFISLDSIDDGDITYEPVGYCPHCGTELKTKEVKK